MDMGVGGPTKQSGGNFQINFLFVTGGPRIDYLRLLFELKQYEHTQAVKILKLLKNRSLVRTGLLSEHRVFALKTSNDVLM